MKMFNLSVYELKYVGIRFRNFVEHFLDAMMKRATVGFLCILGIQHKIGGFFHFL